jgi:hypothetical protein
MSKELMYILITKMHIKLNDLIETSDYDLLCEKVQRYSKRLDRVLTIYNKPVRENCRNSIEITNPKNPDCQNKYKMHS